MATIPSPTGSLTDVTNTIATAVDGDTVTIPAGTWTWATAANPALGITKAITLSGAGIGQTIIRDGCTTSQAVLLRLTPPATKTARLTGIEFNNNGRTSQAFSGIIVATGQTTGSAVPDGRRVRIDHCKFDNLNGLSLQVQAIYGVCDHNEFINNKNMIYVYHPTAYAWADSRWSEASDWGSENFWFIETNTFTRTTTGACVDAYAGARYVARYNTSTRGHWDAHGTESAARARGTRAVEIYNNTMIGPMAGNNFINLRSGVCIAHDNTVTGVPAGIGGMVLLNQRTMGAAFIPWTQADGDCIWDLNDPGNPFYEGTVDSYNSSTRTITISPDPGWDADEWAGYAIRKTSACTVSSTNYCNSMINANTSNTLTFASGLNGSYLSFVPGDTFELNLITQVMDQPGVSGGTDLLGVGSQSVAPPLPPEWNNQVPDPCYEWNNTGDGTPNLNFAVSAINGWQLQIVEGVNYFNDTQAPGYTPYIYPHPLAADDDPPDPPTPPASSGTTSRSRFRS